MNYREVQRIGYETAAFDAFYRQHVDAIERFVARRVNDPYLVADLTADIFVAAVESAASYRRALGSPSAWLYGIAHRVVAADKRTVARQRRAARRIEGRRLMDSDDFARVHERIDAASEARALYTAILELPASERAVLALVALDELAVAEAAEALGIRSATARVRLHRARKALRRQLRQTPIPRPVEASS